ncbi:MAG TPA: hypothetical protein VHJ17_07315 [Thermomonospora sp.]|nr:hypothetical protein [Thermomonospora sp.]
MAEPAYFAFTYGDGPDPEFVIELTNEHRIAEARRILTGVQTDDVHLRGKVVAKRQGYNPHWDFHLAPATVSFRRSPGVEVNDAPPGYLNQHLDQVGGTFLPGHRWSPRLARLTREVTATGETVPVAKDQALVTFCQGSAALAVIDDQVVLLDTGEPGRFYVTPGPGGLWLTDAASKRVVTVPGTEHGTPLVMAPPDPGLPHALWTVQRPGSNDTATTLTTSGTYLLNLAGVPEPRRLGTVIDFHAPFPRPVVLLGWLRGSSLLNVTVLT